MWLRIDDAWTSSDRWDGVPHDARWMLLALIAEASRSERWDGRVPLRVALGVGTIAGVEDPTAALGALAVAGWVTLDSEAVLIHDCEAQYMQPVHLRDNNRKAQQRKDTAAFRARKCAAGEHSKDCPSTCPKRKPRLEDVSTTTEARKDVRKGLRQDRTGQDKTLLGEGSTSDDSGEVEPVCPICGQAEEANGCTPMGCGKRKSSGGGPYG